MSELREATEAKIRPLADVSPIWERELSTYPDAIRVAMDDGTVVTYRQDIRQPAPASYLRAMEILNTLPNYSGYKARHQETKTPNLWERIQAVRQQKG